MLTCLEKTPQLDAVCSNFLAQELNISGDRKISVHQWDKCTAEGNCDCQASLVPFWLDLTKTIFLLMIWTTLGCDTLVQKQRRDCQTDTLHKPSHRTRCHQRAQTSIRHLRVCLLQTHDKNKKKVLLAADQRSWTWRTLIISFHLFHGAARNYQQKSLYSPPSGFSLIIGDFLISIRSSTTLIGFSGKMT